MNNNVNTAARTISSRTGGPLLGQDYFNFLSPNYTLGFSGDTGISGQTTIPFLVKLAGSQPVQRVSVSDFPRNTLQQISAMLSRPSKL